MNQEHITQFDKCWKMFVTKLNGQIKKRSQTGMPSYLQMNTILKDCALDWTSNETACGRWLTSLEKETPEKAELIQQILLDDMQFRENPSKKGIPETVKTVVPVAGAIAGLAISHYAGAGVAAQVISTVAPAAVLMPAMKAIDNQVRESNTSKGVQDYLAQLDMYRNSILSILQQM